ncbi:MAG: MazG family protein [Opitutales bacterium]|nr:MazG family protein [Opitutales bacterium]
MSAIDDLIATLARLRSPGGCPWDLEQTHESLCANLVEETCELLEAIDHGNDAHMVEELGDVLLQVVFHARMAEERGAFSFEDVARGINDKLVRRHPHVFGEAKAEDSAAVLRQWDAIKAGETKARTDRGGFADAVPATLPALLFAAEFIKQLKKRGLEIDDSRKPVQFRGTSEELTEETAGARLFDLAAACRSAGIDPESALRRHVRKQMEQADNAHKRRETL